MKLSLVLSRKKKRAKRNLGNEKNTTLPSDSIIKYIFSVILLVRMCRQINKHFSSNLKKWFTEVEVIRVLPSTINFNANQVLLSQLKVVFE